MVDGTDVLWANIILVSGINTCLVVEEPMMRLLFLALLFLLIQEFKQTLLNDKLMKLNAFVVIMMSHFR